MTWSLSAPEHTVFPRNPLVVVVAQLRFHPILKVADRLADFQDVVRERFPAFQVRASRTVEFREPVGLDVRDEQQFVFLSADGLTTLYLSPTSLGFDCRAHHERADLHHDFGLAMRALLAAHKSVAPTRLGLRYVNAIHRERIERDLGRPVAWSELVTPSFRRVPGDAPLDESTQFASEVTSGTGGLGQLTARCALVSPPGSTGREFRLDFDRYAESGVTADTVDSLLTSFADDIYALFRSAAGPGLEEWMRLTSKQG